MMNGNCASARWNVVILGSGVGGSVLGAILARHGLKVLLVEKAGHPRFAIGESTVPETTLMFRALAHRFGIPEIGYLSTNQDVRRHVSSTCGIKRNFSFATHQSGVAQRPEHITQLSTLSPPLGPDVHFFRQDVDAFMMHTAVAYGACVRQGVDVVDIAFEPERVVLRTRSGESLEADYVVDAGGIQALIPRLLDLRVEPCPLRTRSRAIFTHMIGVAPYDGCIAEHALPSPIAQGTLHHLFTGGWMWVIPFDNHPSSTNRLCSVGLVLDVDHHPATGLSGEEEFQRFIADYPTLKRQFAQAIAVRDWTSTGRLQFSSTRTVGDRFCLLPHAAAFVDPLFSSGLGITMAAINQIAPRLIAAARDGDWSATRFEYVDTWMKHNVDYFDRLVSGSFAVFGDPDLWNAWYRFWILGSFYGVCGLLEQLDRINETDERIAFGGFEQAPFRGIQASDLPELAALFEQGTQIMDAVRAGELTKPAACAKIYAAIESSGLWPAPWGPLDETRAPHIGTFTLARFASILRWIRARAPERVRKNYFTTFRRRDLVARAARDWLQEAKRSSGQLAAHSRDFFTGWNRDWDGAASAPQRSAPED